MSKMSKKAKTALISSIAAIAVIAMVVSLMLVSAQIASETGEAEGGPDVRGTVSSLSSDIDHMSTQKQTEDVDDSISDEELENDPDLIDAELDEEGSGEVVVDEEQGEFDIAAADELDDVLDGTALGSYTDLTAEEYLSGNVRRPAGLDDAELNESEGVTRGKIGDRFIDIDGVAYELVGVTDYGSEMDFDYQTRQEDEDGDSGMVVITVPA